MQAGRESKLMSCIPRLFLILLTAWMVGIPFQVLGQTQSRISQTQSSTIHSAAKGGPTETGPTLAEIDRRLNNPLTSIWSLTFQENFSLNKGDRVDGTRVGNTFFFQPALPIPFGRDMMFIARPVFPLVTNTLLDPTSEDPANSEKTGFGDIQMMSLIGPDRKDGLVWGLGPTFKFPTASHDSLGQDKYQAGPAVLLLSIGKPWVMGSVTQHWWSIAGDSDRPKINRTDFQYIIRRQLPGAMSIGMGPVRWGKMPVKLRFEPQYSIIRPDDFGTAWNFRLQITPVIPSPFK
jgi:hypothetical protein